jgi:uncharacterized protein (TIGR02118 family)
MVTRHWFTRSWGIHSLGALQDGYLARCVRLHLLRSIVDMFKAVALYPMPSDPQAFRDHYESIHLPLVAKLPGVRSLRYSFDLIAPLGEAPFFAVFEVEWDDAEAMRASLTSPEGQAVAEDMAPYVTEGTVLLNYSLQDFLLSAAAIQGDS